MKRTIVLRVVLHDKNVELLEAAAAYTVEQLKVSLTAWRGLFVVLIRSFFFSFYFFFFSSLCCSPL